MVQNRSKNPDKPNQPVRGSTACCRYRWRRESSSCRVSNCIAPAGAGGKYRLGETRRRRLCEGNRVVVRWPTRRDTFRTADFQPPVVATHQPQQNKRGFLIDTNSGRHPFHMVNDDRQVEFGEELFEGCKIFGIDMNPQVSAQRLRRPRPSITESPLANNGSRDFTTLGDNGTGTNDWVLVLETRPP